LACNVKIRWIVSRHYAEHVHGDDVILAGICAVAATGIACRVTTASAFSQTLVAT